MIEKLTDFSSVRLDYQPRTRSKKASYCVSMYRKLYVTNNVFMSNTHSN